MIAEKLRKSVLQAAIQGKLTEQLSVDGDAHDLITNIRAEKAQLAKSGKIKVQKKLPEISEDEIPFEIPDNWIWVKLGEIVNIVSARRVHKKDWKNEGIPFYRAREIAILAQEDSIANELFISKELYDEYAKTGIPQPGDLMVTAVGTLGKTYIVKENDKFYYKDASVICFENRFKISSEYIKIIMESETMRKQIWSNSSGTTVATLTMVRCNNYILPLPPFAEQERIVQCLDKILPQIDELKKVETKLQSIEDAFPEKLKDSLLQAAIQGNLTKQLPEDGDAHDLITDIETEKGHLIKAGEIRKQKELPGINEDEIPFDIPDNWIWVKLQQIASINGGYAFKSTDYTENGIRVVRISDFNENGFVNNKIVRHKYDDSLSPYLLEVGNILLCMTGGTVGKSMYVKHLDEKMMVNQRVAMIKTSIILSKYLYAVILAPHIQSDIHRRKKSTNDNISMSTINEFLVPLPPLAEQERIVQQLDKSLLIFDKLN